MLFSYSALTPRRPRRLVDTLHLPHFTSRGDHRPCRLHPELPNLHVPSHFRLLPRRVAHLVLLSSSCTIRTEGSQVETPFTYQDIEHFVGVYLPSRSKSGNIKRSPNCDHPSLCISLKARSSLEINSGSLARCNLTRKVDCFVNLETKEELISS